jgi:DNA adenine methylase
LSFGGKFFGGYAFNGCDGLPGRFNNKTASNSMHRKDKSLRDAARMGHCMSSVKLLDYADINVDERCLVYCDPPYASTTGYRGTSFDVATFDATVQRWVDAGATVLVSEYTEHDGWVEVASFASRSTLHDNTKEIKRTTDRLFLVQRDSERVK